MNENEEILHDYISGDTINKFFIILQQNGYDTQYCNVYLMGLWDVIPKIDKRRLYLQVLPDDYNLSFSSITHWVLFKYVKGGSINVYDSLNRKLVTQQQKMFLSKALRLKETQLKFHFQDVQQQENGKDCGVYAIAFALSLLLNRNIDKELYVVNNMRPHLLSLIQNKVISPFKTIPRCLVGSGCLNILKHFGESENDEIYNNPSLRSKKKNCTSTSKQFEENIENNQLCNNISRLEYLNYSLLCDEGVTEFIYTKNDDEHDEEMEKYLTTFEESCEVEVEEIFFDTQEQATMETCELIMREHSYTKHYTHLNANKRKKSNDGVKSIKPKRFKSRKTQNGIQENSLIPAEIEQSQILKVGQYSNDLPEFYCGPLEHQCNNCSALHFEKELPKHGEYSQCCNKGKVKINRPKSLPLLQELLTDVSHKQHKHFKEKIRRYNSALSFASCGAQIDTIAGVGPYCYKIHGQIYHKTSHGPGNGTTEPKYAQLYFLDGEEASHHRFNVNANKECDRELMKQLDAALRLINPYAKGYKMLQEIVNEESDKRSSNNSNESDETEFSLHIRKDRNVDCRRYNLPNCNEIAVVFKNEDGLPPFERDIRVYPKHSNNASFININILSCNLDPMCYTLMFPYGEPGWQPNMAYQTSANDRKNKHVTMLQYKKAMLAITVPENPILNYGKLLQQWIVDSYVQVEANNLNYIRFHQSDLRGADYVSVTNFLQRKSEENNCPIGKQIILPSSFEGSPRNMRQKYLDAMSICSTFGPPDLFITFTCNPRWREITENLLYSQTASDRSDLLDRVFSLKLKELLHDVIQNELFGPVLANVYVIEFQKRGLPHAHMLFILKNKILSASQIDEIVCAEIPDPTQDQVLQNIVVNNMLHGPCGAMKPNAFCMKNGKCDKGFPKPFQDETVTNLGGYPGYKRRNNNVVVKNGHCFDNRYVVPYNKYLLKKYNAHINVEVCTTIKSVKYIFKYIYKGYDCASVQVLHNGDTAIMYDEISSYLDCRYVGACEATWRLMEFKMHDKSHSVQRLEVHLPGEQSVVFKENLEENAILNADSTLLAWFKLNQSDLNSKNYRYIDIPQHYVFNKKTKKWTVRKCKFNIVTRLYSVDPKKTELFYLRMLLLHCKGATSYEDIRTVNEECYETFEAAALAKGLIKDNRGCIQSMEEMSVFEMPAQMRKVFCYMCIFCIESNANILWSQFCDILSEDFQKRYQYDLALQKTLQEIDEILQLHSSSCEQLNLPIDRELLKTLTEEENALLTISTNVINQQALNTLIDSLNEKQFEIFNEICSTFDDKNALHRCFFIDGPGGCGKTYLYNVITEYVQGKGSIVFSFATTGIAALLLVNGKTVHSGCKLPIPIADNSTSYIRLGSKEAEQLKKCDIIIIDECSMMDKFMLECIDRLLRFIMQNDRVFGGKIIILGGDFRQTLPVIPRASSTVVIERCLKSCNLWRHFKQLSLTQNMRCVGDDSFNKWLLSIGDGTANDDNNMIQLDQKFISNDIIADTYGNNFNKNAITSKIILCVKNTIALELNNLILDLLPGFESVYYSDDSVVSDDPNERDRYPIDYLYSLTPSGMPPHELRLKEGSVVMLIRNLNLREGLCNGTRLIVKKLYKYVIECEILTGVNISHTVILPQIDLTPSDTTLPFKLKRTQFPLIPAFAITINKSQGQTFDYVGVNLTDEVFSHGQLYTAFSRVTNENNLKIKLSDDSLSSTKNIVYSDVL